MKTDDHPRPFIFFRFSFLHSLNRSYSPIAAKERSKFDLLFHLRNFARSMTFFSLLFSSPILDKKGASAW